MPLSALQHLQSKALQIKDVTNNFKNDPRKLNLLEPVQLHRLYSMCLNLSNELNPYTTI